MLNTDAQPARDFIFVASEEEEWRPIPGCSDYEASSAGRIIRRTRGKGLGDVSSTGYVHVNIRRDGEAKQSRKSCHRLVWEAFNGPIPAGMVIDHINGMRSDNRLANLRLATYSDNSRYRWEKVPKKPPKPYIKKGYARRPQKLTEKQVREIIADSRPGRLIAAAYGVSGATICLIKQRKTWRHLEAA